MTSSSEGDLLARCPELPLVVEKLSSAIDVGSPAVQRRRRRRRASRPTGPPRER